MKRTLTSIAAAGLVLGTMVPAAFAASTANNAAKVVGTKAVIVNGKLLSSPFELTAMDSGNTTAYFGIYYFNQAIKALGTGFDASWDGNTHTWNITAPSLDASKIAGGVGTGNTSIVINGQLVKKINTFSHVDPAGGGQTTYFPVYYVNQILGAIGASGSWVATAGLTASYTVGAPANITLTPGASEVANTPGTTTTFTAKVVDANGHPVPGVTVDFNSSSSSVLSVPVSAVTDSHGMATVTGTVGSLEGSVTITATVDSDVNLSASTTVNVTQIAASAAKVLNASQIQYTFNEAVDPTTAQNAANYSITDNLGNQYAGGATVALQSDGKTVVLTLAAPIPNGKVVNFQVTNVQALNNPSRVLPLYATTLTVNDVTPPAITKVSASTNGVAADKVVVDFSEPVNQGVGTFVIDGQAVPGAGVAWSSPTEVTLTPTSVLSTSKSHTLTVYGLTDTAGNTASPLTQSFTVTSDSAQPTATSTAINDHQIEVTFSKPVNEAQVIAGLSLADESLAPEAKTVTHDDVNDPAGAGATYGTKYVVTINAAAGTLYASSSSRTFTVGLAAGAVSDSLTNTNAAYTQQVTLHEDTTAPAVTGVTYDTDSAGNVLDVVFNVSKGLNGGNVDPTKIKVIDPSNADVSAAFLNPALVTPAAGSTKVVIPVQAAYKKPLSGTYTFYIPASWVTDNSNDANTNAAVTLTLNFGAATGSFKVYESDINGGNYANTTWNGDGTETFTIQYEQPVYGGSTAGSATLASDYTLNGAALPSGSIITLDSATNTVSITLPAGSIAADNSFATLGVSNVKNTSGVVVTPFTGYVTVFDNTAPVLQSAQVLSATQILLTFNEAMKDPAGADAAAELTISNNNVDFSGDAFTATSVAGHPNQVLITLSGGNSLDLTHTIKITTKSGAVVLVDGSAHNNAQKSGVTVTATN